MREFPFLLLAFLFPVLLYGQPGSKSLSVQADWRKGARYTYLITRIQQQFQNDVLITEFSVEYQAEMEVVDSTGTFYTIKWSIPASAFYFDEDHEVSASVHKYMAEETIEIVYRTTRKGAFQGIENMDDIAGMISTAAKKALKEELAVKDNTTAFELLSGYAGSDPDRELLALRISTEIRAVHFPFGNAFPLDGEVSFTEEIQNELGGEDLLCTGYVRVENVDFDLKYFVAAQELSLDDAEAERALADYFSEFATDEGELSGFVNGSKISVFEDNVYEYLYQPGIPLSIEKSRTVKIDLLNDVSLSVEELYIQSLDDHELNIGK